MACAFINVLLNKICRLHALNAVELNSQIAACVTCLAQVVTNKRVVAVL